jgi:hypothetical protein
MYWPSTIIKKRFYIVRTYKVKLKNPSFIYKMVIIGLFYAVNCPVIAAELGLSAGSFHFPATDYYYPNFYDEAGFRGEITFQKEGWPGFFVRLQSYAYPMDDNIFENILEVGFTQRYESEAGSVYIRPLLGYGLPRFQYVAPYFVGADMYLHFARLGYDAGYSINLSRFAVGANNRGRWVINVGSKFYDRNTVLWAFDGEIGFRLSGRWRTSVRGGAEFDGYYEKIFLRENVRPYVEAGIYYSF